MARCTLYVYTIVVDHLGIHVVAVTKGSLGNTSDSQTLAESVPNQSPQSSSTKERHDVLPKPSMAIDARTTTPPPSVIGRDEKASSRPQGTDHDKWPKIWFTHSSDRSVLHGKRRRS